jgi:hypothetical protein
LNAVSANFSTVECEPFPRIAFVQSLVVMGLRSMLGFFLARERKVVDLCCFCKVARIKNKAVGDVIMAQVFISFSRKDREFVHRHDQELTRRGRQARVDWKGIQSGLLARARSCPKTGNRPTRFVTAISSIFSRPAGTLLPFLFGLLLAGCSVLFVAPYDATTDRLLTDLTVRTETVVVQADNDQLSVAEREKFYAEAQGTVNAMKMRAGLYAKNEQEIAALDELAKRYQALAERHASPRTSLTTGLRATLLDVQQIQVAKKRSSVFSSGLNKTSTSQ